MGIIYFSFLDFLEIIEGLDFLEVQSMVWQILTVRELVFIIPQKIIRNLFLNIVH